MNCVSENCKYVQCKVIKNESYKYFKSILVFKCALGGNVSYPAIDENKYMLCKYYKKTESKETNND